MENIIKVVVDAGPAASRAYQAHRQRRQMSLDRNGQSIRMHSSELPSPTLPSQKSNFIHILSIVKSHARDLNL
jgi:hypothetical protein